MVVDFPQFNKVTLEDKRFFDEFNAQFPPYADWAFGTLMTWWDIFDDLEASQLNGNVIIKSSYLSMGGAPRLTLLGNQHIDETVSTIFAFQKQHNYPQALYSLPQYTVDALRVPNNYTLIDDLNAAEYISSINSHITLEGSSLYHMRKAVHRFERSMLEHTLDITYVSLDTLQAKMLLINSLHTWHDIYKNDRELLEGLTIDRALLIAEHIDLQSLCIFIDKQLAGFVLYKPLHGGYANINHIKVSKEYPNLFRYLTHTAAVYLQPLGYDYLNGEQDLGIEGLRKYKTSLQPIEKFHKYDIYPSVDVAG